MAKLNWSLCFYIHWEVRRFCCVMDPTVLEQVYPQLALSDHYHQYQVMEPVPRGPALAGEYGAGSS